MGNDLPRSYYGLTEGKNLSNEGVQGSPYVLPIAQWRSGEFMRPRKNLPLNNTIIGNKIRSRYPVKRVPLRMQVYVRLYKART